MGGSLRRLCSLCSLCRLRCKGKRGLGLTGAYGYSFYMLHRSDRDNSIICIMFCFYGERPHPARDTGCMQSNGCASIGQSSTTEFGTATDSIDREDNTSSNSVEV